MYCTLCNLIFGIYGYPIPSRTILTTKIVEAMMDDIEEKVAGVVDIADYISFSTDGWSIKEKQFVSLTVHLRYILIFKYIFFIYC